jgi:putative transposase
MGCSPAARIWRVRSSRSRCSVFGARLLLQVAIEAELTAYLGRDRYERAAGCESLVIAGFVGGLSVRDVEATLVEALGEGAAVSKSTVSRICEDIKTQFEAWSARRLDEVELDYLFLDGSHFKYHANASAEPVLAAWGIDTDGKPVFVGLDTASAESGEAGEGFLSGLGERGLRAPLLVISDGAPGLIGAVERTMGAALRQRCLIHRARINLLAKVPKSAQSEVKADYRVIFDLPDDVEPGLDAVAAAQARIDSFAKRWRDSYPAAVRCLLDDRDSLTVYLRFPREHWNRVRHFNFERTFGETRRRVKVIGRLPGEHSCLSLVWAVLDRASAGWRGFTMTPTGLRLLAACAVACMARQPNYRTGIRQSMSKHAWRRPIPPQTV